MVRPDADDLEEKAAGTVEGTTLTAVAGTADDASVRAMVGQVVGALGGVDILVNCGAHPRAEGRRSPGG